MMNSNKKEVLRLLENSMKLNEKLRIIDIIQKRINDLNKEKNYSLLGEKKLCCQAELINLENAILGLDEKEKEKEIVRK